MSDTQDAGTAPDADQDDVPALPPLPNLTIEPGDQVSGRQSVVVSYGVPPAVRRIEVLKPDLGDQLDLAEMADTSTMNLQWLSLAMAGLAVRSVNGVPVPPTKTKADIKRNLRTIGEDGLRAVQHALVNSFSGSAAEQSVAKNSQGTPASAS